MSRGLVYQRSGIKVVAPSTPYDAKGLLISSIRDNNPVLFMEHKLLYRIKGHVPEEMYTIPLGKAEVKREGKDLTIIAYSIMTQRALEAAAVLEKEGIDVEIIDPRSLKPFDLETINQSVMKTGRVLIVHEAPKTGGFGAEIAALITEGEAFDCLDAPIKRLAGRDIPIPYNRTLERAAVPQVEDIVREARRLAQEGGRMPTEIIMPKVDMVQDTGVFVEWLKKEGERVKQGEPLFVIMSDKAAIEIEAPAEGILAGCSAKKDDVIPVAQTIGYILQEGETLPKPETIKSPKALSFKEALPADFPFAKEDTTSAVAPTKDEKTIIRATPLARKTAKEHQIDLSNIKGRGERGRIHQADVLAYLENRSKVEQTYKPDTSALPPIPIPEARIKNKIPLVGARKIIAERMRLSASQIPHFYESIHVNAGELIRLQKILEPTIQSKHQLKLTYTCVLALAVSRTLMLHPNFNASLVGDEIIQWEDIHIGIATALEDNLVVPVVRNTQTKNLLEITKEINRLTAAAKERN
jgi:pyruvate/2-oxoglutarate dehydrogenase complex dihydrolipoamide acyltransferase (E2) component